MTKKSNAWHKLKTKIVTADERVQNLKVRLRAAEDASDEARYEYTKAIAPRVIEIVKEFEWIWPSKRGKRVARASVIGTHELITLLHPIDGRGRHYRIQLTEDAEVTVVKDYYRDHYEARLDYKSAKALGIVNPAKRKDWSKIKAKLEAAGIDDPEKLAELLEKKTSE